ncbi:hypothetical protein [Paenibacillus taiwanensis]|uniref:hypothetical protein n=1 Tax=Paenibacillus taiwanensis TaxID=401638 RepID=UPI000405C6CE|nr:hypothetical protein [Paenibacillus taiwanensis]
MKSFMKWLKRIFFGIVILIVIIAAALYFYIKPNEHLGWAPPVQVTLTERIDQMIRQHAPEIAISEAELNGYAAEWVRKELHTSPILTKWKPYGMHIELQQDQLLVKAEIEPWQGIRASVQIPMDLSWNVSEQIIQAVPTGVYVKDLQIPQGWIEVKPIQIQAGAWLHEFVKVKQMHFEEGKWRIRLGLKL